MIFTTPPKGFHPSMEVAACFLLHGKEFLSLETAKTKKLTGLWGIPAGKLDKGETPLAAVVREVHEETGIILTEKEVTHFQTVYIRWPSVDFVYHMFWARLSTKPVVLLQHKEHSAYAWGTEKDILLLPQIPDEDACVKLFFAHSTQEK